MPVAFYGGAHDDFLFVGQAASILAGHWLGPFGPLTLAKGPVFPLFLAGCAVLHLPPHVGEQGVLLGASWVAADVGARCGALPRGPARELCSLDPRMLRTFVFAVLAANPAPLDLITTDLMREPLYAGLTLLVLALAARLWLLGGGTLIAISLGLAFAAFWGTRQEGVLILPALALMAASGVRRPRTLLVPALAAALPLLALCAVDARTYGVFRLDDMNAGPFSRAYGALARVGDAPRERYVPIPNDAVELAARVSPAAATLAPYLEGPGRAYWAAPGCGENPIPGCAEKIQAGWFMWALRQAAVDAGHYRDARETDRFWRRLNREIDAACATRRIPCTRERDTLRPAIAWPRDAAPILHETARATWAALRLGPPTLGTYPTRPFADASTYRCVVRAGPVASTGLDIFHVSPLRGWHARAARLLAGLMPLATVVLAPLGVLLLLRRPRRETVFMFAVLLAIGARLAMLGVLSATAIRLQFRYVSPIFPEVLLLSVWGLAEAIRWGRSRRGAGAAPAPR